MLRRLRQSILPLWLRKYKTQPHSRLGVLELEDRNLLSVTSSLSAGVLSIQFSADNDSATLSRSGANVVVTDGTTSQNYAVGSVASVNLGGTTGDDQSITISANLNLTGNFLSNAVESVTFADNVSFGARSLVSHAMGITGANTITVGAGATLFTRAISGGDPLNDNSTANSGSLNFSAKNIDVRKGAKIYSHADSSFQPGNITLRANDSRTDTYVIPLFNSKQAQVSLNVAEDAIFKGRDITLATDANSTRLTLYELGKLATSPPTLPNTTISKGLTFEPGRDDGSVGAKITRADGSWTAENFAKDKTITISGTPDAKNDGTYSIGEISPDGKSLVLITSDAVRQQSIASGTNVTVRVVDTSIAAGDVPFQAVDENGNAIAGQPNQKQSEVTAGAARPVNFNPVLNFLSDLPLPLQVSLTQVYAKTTLGNNVQITGSNNVSVTSKAVGYTRSQLPSLILGVTWTESDVQAITKIGNAKINAGGSFSATSEVINDFKSANKTLGGTVQHPATGDPVQLPGASISVAVARGNSVSTAETSDGTTITAGGVTIDSKMTNKFVNESSATTSKGKGFAGSVGVTVADHNEQAAATLRGTVVSTGDVTVHAEGANEAVENRSEASVNTDKPEAASPMIGTFTAITKFLSSAKDKQDNKSKNDSGSTLQIAGSVVVVFSDQSTYASIADNANVTVSGGKLEVTVESESAPQASAVGSAEANSKLAVGGAFIYGDYSMDSKAWIGNNAIVNVDKSISVTAESKQIGGFPISVGDFVGGALGLRDSGLPWVSDGTTTTFSKAVSKSGDFLDAIGGGFIERGRAAAEGDWSSLLQEFSVSFVSASAQPGEVTDKYGNVSGKSNAASGNFDMVFAKNYATAWIGEGAKINQNTPNADAKEQSVTVEAKTETKSLYFGGLTGKGNPFGYTTVGGNGAIGGVYAHHDQDVLAKAYIADGAMVKAAQDVTVNAEDTLIVGVWDFAGSQGKNFGVQGTFTVTPVDSVVLAYIENSATVDAGGNLAITAKTDDIFVTFTGAIANSDQLTIGVGLGYFDVDTTTKAFIGNYTTSTTYPGKGTITVGGDTAIDAATSTVGATVAISAALSLTPPPPPPPTLEEVLDDGETLTNLFALPDETQPTNTKQKSESDQLDKAKSSTGFNLSGSLGLNLFDATTFAGIDNTTITVGGNLGVNAKSNELYIVATGAASLNLNTKADSSTSIAGAVSWNDLDRNVTANINNTIVSAGNVTVAADAKNLLVAVTAGAAVTSPSQQANTSIGIAGSANINDLDTTVSATLSGTTKVTSTGSIAVTAKHDVTVVSVAGAVGVSQRAGIGAAFDLGLHTTTVEAKVADGIELIAAKDVTVSATDAAAFVSIGASIAVAVDKLGISGSASWTNVTTNVTAALGNNVKVTAGGDLKVLADESVFAFGLGGAAAIGGGTAIGAGIAGINLQRNVNATIGTGGIISVAGSTAVGDHGVFVQATTEDDLYLFGAGGAVAKSQAAVAGSLSLLIDNTTTNASIGSTTTISQPADKSDHTMSVFVEADHDSNILTVAGAFSLGKSAGVGFGVVVMPITHNVTASIASSANVSANNDIRVQAYHKFDADNIAAALSAALAGVGAAGAGVIQPLDFTTTATVGSSAVLRANGNIVITADSEYDMLGIAGNGALGLGGSGIGVSNVTTVRNETVKAEVGNFASLTALGNKATYAAADDSTSLKNVRGLIVTSTLDDDTIVVSAGAAAGTSGAGIAGSVTVTVQTTNVTARLGEGVSVTPNAADRLAANAAQDTYLYAEHLSDLAGAGGGGGFGSSGGVGVGVDVGTINRTTRAIIDKSANVNNRGDVSVRAVAGGDWISVGASIGGGGTAGIAGSASVQVHTITTQARIGDHATVFAVGNVVVTAKDELQTDSIAGQISIGGTAGVGGSVPVVVITKTTDASIGDSTIIDALANTSAFQAQITPPSVVFTDSLFFTKSKVDTSANSINLGYAHGFQTGDTVTYWANGSSIGTASYTMDGKSLTELSNGGTFFAIVVDSTTIKLAATEADAKASTAIDLTSQGSSDKQSITAYGEVAAPAVNDKNATDDGFSKQRKLSFGSTGVRGVVVSSISIDDYATYGISGGGGGTVGVQIVASVSIPKVTTTATIGNSAKINQNDAGANAGQSVTVAAIADYNRLGIGGSIAIGGAAGIAPLADVLVSKHITKASIGTSTQVGAERDVIVAADATEDIRAFVIGVAGGGTAAVAGSVGVMILKTQTQAIIDSSAVVYAGGNVVVSANDTTDGLIVIGSAAVGIGAAGVGASVDVSIIEKDTLAKIGDNANVTALAGGSGVNAYTGDGFTKAAVEGVIVQAVSDEEILDVVIAGGAGFYAGVAGAVNVNIITANTVAQLGGGVTINGSGTANADQSVTVAAIDKLNLDVINGAAGLGAGGVAGSVDVGIIRSNTNANVGSNATVNAKQDISIGSATLRDVDSFIIGASGGLGALATSVGVYSLYAAVEQASKDSLIGSHDKRLFPRSEVDVNANQISFSTANNHNFRTGDAVKYSANGGTAIGGLTDGATYYAIRINDSTIKLATSQANATAGTAIDLTSQGSNDDQSITTVNRSNGASYADSATSTSVISDGLGSYDKRYFETKQVETKQGETKQVDMIADQISFGTNNNHNLKTGDAVTYSANGGTALGGLTDGATYYAIRVDDSTLKLASSQANATTGTAIDLTDQGSNNKQSFTASSRSEGGRQLSAVGKSAMSSLISQSPSGAAAGAVNVAAPTPSGTSATVGSSTKLNAGGNLSVLASDNVQIDVITGTAAVGGVGLGASVSYVSVGGQSLASVGNSATLTGSTIKVSSAYFGDAEGKAYGGAAGGFVGIGAQVAIVNDSHNETASVGNSATVNASNKFMIATNGNRALDTSNAGGGLSLGFAGGASYAKIHSSGIASSSLGSSGNVTTGLGGMAITSDSNATTDVSAVGVAAGFVAASVTLADVKVTGGASATVGSGTVVSSTGDVSVTANYKSVSDLDAVSITIGGVGSIGVMDVTFTDSSTTTAKLDNVGKFDITGNLSVTASADNSADSNVVGGSVGGLTGSGAGVTVSASPTVSATVSTSGIVAVGKSINIIARAGSEFDADTTGANIGAVAVGASIITINWTPNVTATVGGGSTLSAAQDLTVRSLINYDSAGLEQTAKTVDVSVIAVAGGLAAGSAAVVAVTLSPTSNTTVGAGASLSATDRLRIGSDQRTRTNVNLTGVNFGFVAGGAVIGNVAVHASSTVLLPDSLSTAPTRLSGSRGVTVKSGIDHGGRANVVGGAGGLYGAAAGAKFNYYLSGPNNASNTDYVPVSVSIGKNAVVSSAGLTDLGTFVKIDFESDSFLAGIGGLVSAVDSNLTTESYVASAVTVGESAKIGTRNLRISTDQNVRSDTDTDAQAYGVFGAATDTDSNSRYFATNAVSVATGAVIIATGVATIENANGNVAVRADSYARGVAFAASVSAESNGTRRMTNTVTIATGSEIITPRLAVQSLRPAGSLDVSADSTNASAVGFFISIWNALTGGSVGRTANSDGNVGSDTVDLNAAITLGSPRNVQLYIDANGGITKQNWPTVVIEPTRVVVDDIFSAQPERLDVRAPNGTTKGTSTVTYGVMESVTIENASKRTLVLRNIDTFSAPLKTPIYNHEGSTKGWTYTESKSTVTNGESTTVSLRNTAIGTGYDVQLSGRIDVVEGSVSITANGGNVYSLSPNGFINSRIVTLNATAGALGTTANPLFIRTPEQTNTTLPVGIQSAHGETGGNLNVSVTSPTKTDFTYRLQNITSNTGTMKIVANEGSAVTRGITTEVQLNDGSGHQGTVLGLLTFDPANSKQFDAAADTITLNFDHQLKTGDRVTYQPIGLPIGGIVPYVEREVKVIDARTIQFSTGFNTNDVSVAKDTISFSSPHGIQTGEAVVYDNTGSTSIGGLTSGMTYYAWAYDNKTVQVYNSQANANATGNKFFANAIQHIKNPGFVVLDKDAKSDTRTGLQKLEYIDVIAMSAVNTFTTGTKIQYWTHDTNALRLWNGTGSGVKYWTNTLTYTPSLKSKSPDVYYEDGDLNDPANPNEDYTSIAAANDANYVTLPTLTYFYAVEVPNPENKEVYKGLIALASTSMNATNGVLTKLTTSEAMSQGLHYLRSTTGLMDITSAPTNQTQAFRADLTAPLFPGLHIIDTNSVYVQDSKGVITRVSRDDVRSIREVVAETLTTTAGTTTLVELGTITSTAGDVHIEVGTSSTYATEAKIVNTLSAVAGTMKIEVDGGSLSNGTTKTNIIAKTADLTTWNNIGSSTTPITGKVQFLTAQAGLSGTGGIWFENTGLLTLQNMKAVNDLQVVVVDRVGTGDDIVVDPTATVQSTTDTVYLKAGDKIIIPTSAKVVGFDGIQFFFNYNDVDGTGNIIDLRGFSGSKVIDVYGNVGTVDTILDVNDMNYVIQDNKLLRYVGRTLDTTFNLYNVTGDHFNITAGGKDNSIDVTGWTGTGIYDGGVGMNRVIAVNDVNFDLSDTTLSRTGHGNITFVNDTVNRANLTGGVGDNSFTVTNWSYQASLNGAGGKDTLTDVNDVNYVLSDSSMSRSTVGQFNLSNIEHAELTSGALDNRFEVSEWTGTAKLDGGAGLNNVATVRDGDYDLSNTNLTREIDGTTAGAFELANIAKSLIIGGESDNTFNLTGWTGQAFLEGETGQDRVVTKSNSDGVLNSDFIARGDGGQIQVGEIEMAVLIGGTGANAFLIEGWAGNVLVDGAGGGDKLMVNANTDYTLTATSIKLENGTNIDVANLTKVTLNGGNEDNSITIEEQPDFYTVINAFGGDNHVTISANGNFNLTQSNLAIDGMDRYYFGDVDRIVLVGTSGDNQFLIDGWEGGLAIHGGDGKDTATVVADTNFSLTNGEINLETGYSIDLFDVEGVVLHGGDSDNRFEINGWTGTATIQGGDGVDVVQALVPNNVRLTDGSLEVQNGPTVTLVDVERAVLIGQPGSDHAYSIENYTGQVSIIGTQNAFDRLVVVSAGKFDLQTGHLVLGTGGTVDFSGIDFTVLQGAADKQNFFNIGGGVGEVSLIGGNTGLDQVRVVADADFVLDDSAVLLNDGTTIHLNNITKATLVGGDGDNKFNVSGWTGFAVIDGGAGTDTVISTNDTNFVLTQDTLQRSDGAYFSLVGIENVQLTGGAGNNQFIVEDWAGKVALDGGEGDDDYVVTLDGVGHSRISINDTGASGTDRLRVAIPFGSSPIVTLHGVWLGDDQLDYDGIEDFDLI